MGSTRVERRALRHRSGAMTTAASRGLPRAARRARVGRAALALARLSMVCFVALARAASPPEVHLAVERPGGMTFVLAVRLSGANASASPGVDVVVTRASDYPTWAAPGVDPPTLARVRRAAAREDPAALGFVAGTSATPPPYFRASVKVPGSGANARVLVEGAYNPRRPELDWPNVASFAVRPNTTYVVVAAPRADSTHAAQPGDPQVATLTVRTAEKVSSNASLAALGLFPTVALVPWSDARKRGVASYEAAIGCDVANVTAFATPSFATSGVTIDGRAARPGPARRGGAVPEGAFASGPTLAAYGRNAPIKVVVTAEDRETTSEHEIFVTRARSAEARLAGLVLRSHAMNASFDPDAFAYAASVPHATASVRVIPRVMDDRAQAMRVNMKVQASGAVSRDLHLRPGKNSISVEVTAHDAVSVKAYRLDVVRAFASTDARLGLLLVESVSETSAGRHLGPEFVGTARSTHALVPPFDSSVVLNDAAPDAQGVVEQSAHAVVVDHGVERVTLTAAPRDASARLEVLVEFLPLDGPTHERRLRHGRPDPGGAKLPAPWNVPASIFDVDLDVGTTRITLRVDAEDPRFAREVVVDVTRDAPGSDAVLADLGVFVGPGKRVPRMVPAFDPAVFEYAVQITFESTGAYVVPVARDEMYKEIRVNTKTQPSGAPSATYPVAAGGKSIIKVVVTAHDNAVKETYTITVSRDAPNANAFLKALDVTEGTLRPPFSKTTFSYALGPISHASPSVRVLAEPEDAGDGTRVEVNGKWTPNGALSAEIPIAAGYGNGDEAVNGTGLITIVAWAQDGRTSLAYRVEVTREPPPIFPNDASLRALATEPRSARLSPPFDPNTRAYRLYVPARETSVRVRPIANDANAYRVAVNGVDVDGGAAHETTTATLVAREDVELLIEVFANDCDPAWRPQGHVEGVDPKPTCTHREYVVELLEYGPGAYEGKLRLFAGDAEDPGGAIREMRPFPSPFREGEAFVESMSWQTAEFDQGNRSTGVEGHCDEWLCANSVVDATLIAMDVRVASVAPRAPAGDAPDAPAVGAEIAYAPRPFRNVTRYYEASPLGSHRVDRIEVNVTAASSRVAGVTIDGVAAKRADAERANDFLADVALATGANDVVIEVTAARYDVRRFYVLRVTRPPSPNAHLADLRVPNLVAIKRAPPNLTGVPRRRFACDVHASARARRPGETHPWCDGADAALRREVALAAHADALAYPEPPSPETRRPPGPVWHPCDGDAPFPERASVCAEAPVSESPACSGAAPPATDDGRDAVGFDPEWSEYVVNVPAKLTRVHVNATAADPAHASVSVGNVRNCRAAPSAEGCDVADRSAWGWDGGETGIVDVRSASVSPPIEIAPGATRGTVVVRAQDGVTRRAYAVRAVQLVPDAMPRLLGVGPFVEALIAAADAGAPRAETRFVLRFAGVNPLWIVDAEFKRTLEAHVVDYVAHAADADVEVRADARASPRKRDAPCERRVADAAARASDGAGGVDVSVVATFFALDDARGLEGWANASGWSTDADRAFDAYLAAFAPVTLVNGTVATRETPPGFEPRRRSYAGLVLPPGASAVPITVPPPGPGVEGFAARVQGEAVTPGAAATVAVPPCPAGPRHCDDRAWTVEAEACVFARCVAYAFLFTIPAAPIPSDDASLRAVRVESAAPGSLGTPFRIAPAFYHDVGDFRVLDAVDRADAFVRVAATPNAALGSRVFVNRARVDAAGNFTALVALSDLEHDLDGVVTIRVVAPDGVAKSDTRVRVNVANRSPAGLRRGEARDPLAGAYGFDGGGLPAADDADWRVRDAPAFAETYPRLEPVWEGGPHLEVAAQTRTPAVVHWAVAVPWGREPTSREVAEAATRVETSRLVGGSVAAFLAARSAANLSAPTANATERAFVAAGTLRGPYMGTRELRATIECLDPTVAFDAWFVAETTARRGAVAAPNGSSARAGDEEPPLRTHPVAARGVRPGSGPMGLLLPFTDAAARGWAAVVSGVVGAGGGEALPGVTFDALARAAALASDPTAPAPSATTAVSAFACDVAVEFEVAGLEPPASNASSAEASGRVAVEARRLGGGGDADSEEWVEVVATTTEALRGAGGGWVAVTTATIAAGEGWVLRWRYDGTCCFSWGLRNVRAAFVTP